MTKFDYFQFSKRKGEKKTKTKPENTEQNISPPGSAYILYTASERGKQWTKPPGIPDSLISLQKQVE